MPDFPEWMHPLKVQQLPDATRRQLRRQLTLILYALESAELGETPAQQDRMLSAKEVAARLRVSPGWVYEQASGQLKAARVALGTSVRFSEKAIEDILRRKRGG